MRRPRWTSIGLAAATAAALTAAAWWAAPSAHPSSEDGESRKTQQKLETIHEAVREYLRNKKLDEAEKILDRLLEKHPKDPQAHVLMAKLSLARNHPAAALDSAERALELEPDQPEVRHLAGVLSFTVGKPKVARRHLKQAIRLSPDNARYHLYLARAEMKLDRPEAAERRLREALRLDSTLAAAHGLRAQLAAERGNRTLALEEVDKAIAHTDSEGKDLIGYHLQKAKLLRKMGEPSHAIRVLRELPEKHQKKPTITQELATCYWKIDKPEQAAAAWGRTVAARPANAALAAKAGLAFLRAGRRQRATLYYEVAHRRDPNHPQVKKLKRALNKNEASGDAR